jgi:hypothetical protein
MRAGDYAAATQAFDTLAASSDPKTRDDARLARAQLWIATHQAGRARTELEDLSTTGATALVRARAADALRALDDGARTP